METHRYAGAVGEGQVMGEEAKGFSLLQVSVVQEMANIGLGRAATALSELTGDSFIIDVPRVESCSMDSLAALMEADDEPMVAARTGFHGDMNGHLAFLLTWSSCTALVQTLTGMAPAGLEEIDEMTQSVVLEVGNIVNSNFLNAIAEMTGMTLNITPPEAAVDSIFTIASSVLVLAEMDDCSALAIETKIESASSTVRGWFMCIPSAQSLHDLFASLGVLEAA